MVIVIFKFKERENAPFASINFSSNSTGIKPLTIIGKILGHHPSSLASFAQSLSWTSWTSSIKIIGGDLILDQAKLTTEGTSASRGKMDGTDKTEKSTEQGSPKKQKTYKYDGSKISVHAVIRSKITSALPDKFQRKNWQKYVASWIWKISSLKHGK